MSSKIQPAVPKKSKKSSKQDELIYKNKIKEDGQDERLKEKAAQYRLFENNDTFQTALKPKFTFIDLFAGIGGFRIAMQNLGGEYVFSSEWDEKAKLTYEANFGEVLFGDITLEEIKQYIPKQFDVLCGFTLSK